jgi:hypothetical protein
VLPSSLNRLAGQRAARWTRESTKGQEDRFGPDAQRDQQDRAISDYGMVDVTIADPTLNFRLAHSGRTIADTSEFKQMLARAGTRCSPCQCPQASRGRSRRVRFVVDLDEWVNPT